MGRGNPRAKSRIFFLVVPILIAACVHDAVAGDPIFLAPGNELFGVGPVGIEVRIEGEGVVSERFVKDALGKELLRQGVALTFSKDHLSPLISISVEAMKLPGGQSYIYFMDIGLMHVVLRYDELRRGTRLEDNAPKYAAFAETWGHSAYGTVPMRNFKKRVKRTLARFVDEFTSDYSRAHDGHVKVN